MTIAAIPGAPAQAVGHRGPVQRAVSALAVLLALSGMSQPGRAFPGILVGKDAAPRFVNATQIVVMRHRGVSVFTVMVDYEGPFTPFALLLPIPVDVRESQVRTVKRGILHRVERVSAPRFHAFYEQDPCTSGPPEQEWERSVETRDPGFLASPGLPPLDDEYTLSNLLTAPIEPVFKKIESEFVYEKLEPASSAELLTWVREKGYRISSAALSSMARHVGPGKSLLFAEVSLKNVEMTGPDRIQLGGIRFWTEKPWLTLPITLGLQNSGGMQDLILYVFDRESRYQAKNYPNLLPPTNLATDARASERLGVVYNALFDRVVADNPRAFVTEFAWSTGGCGLPCPDAPLALDELMTLGGDVLEARTSKPQVFGSSIPQSARDRRRFEQQLARLPAGTRDSTRRERENDLRELARRQALLERHEYILSRLHHRYSELASDVELEPAGAVSGGIGVPQGPMGELPRAALPTRAAAATEPSQFQVRFLSLHPWKGDVPCNQQFRFRWGKRWPSKARAPRAVALATDLSRTPRDPTALTHSLKTRIPELGLGNVESSGAPEQIPRPVQDEPSPACSRFQCGFAAHRASSTLLVWCLGLLWLCRRRFISPGGRTALR